MLNYRKKFVFFLITTAMVFGGCFGVAGKVEAEYFAAGTSTSINLLEGMDVPSIDSFYCNASSVPSGTALKFRYSTTSTSGPWVNSNGTKDGWDEVATTGGATTSLSGLNWGGSIFYYQVRLESDTNGSTTPELDKIELNYSNPPPNSPTNPLPADGATDQPLSPTLSVDVYDDDGDPMIVSFYDSSDDSLIGTTSIATTSPPATSTATTSWNNLSASTTYNWYAVSDDGEATTSSSVWSFTTLPPPNSPTNLSQYKKDCSTAITTGEVLATTSICFEAQIEPNSGYDVKLQLDYSASSLDGIPEATSSTWKSTTSTISILNSLPEGGTYKWQVRTIDSSGATSSWTQFNSGDTAFVVKVYFAAGTSTSVNLLEGLSVNNIQSFYYDASLLPGEGALKFRFATSSTSGPWYDKDGNLNQWTEANTTGRGNIHLADLGWSGPNFYYQARFEATTEGLYGPELDLIGVEYNVESVDIKGDTVLRNIEIGFFSGSKEEDSESFESGFGDWYDDTSDDAWTRNSGSTGSSGTGPSSAYDGSYYIYVETSSGDGANSSGDKTTIEYDLGSTKDGYVDFYVHQYGTDMGTLYLQGWDGSSWNTIWSTTDNTDSWRHIQQANTEFSGYSKLRFQNVAAGGYEGDVALDLIKVFSN